MLTIKMAPLGYQTIVALDGVDISRHLSGIELSAMASGGTQVRLLYRGNVSVEGEPGIITAARLVENEEAYGRPSMARDQALPDVLRDGSNLGR